MYTHYTKQCTHTHQNKFHHSPHFSPFPHILSKVTPTMLSPNRTQPSGTAVTTSVLTWWGSTAVCVGGCVCACVNCSAPVCSFFWIWLWAVAYLLPKLRCCAPLKQIWHCVEFMGSLPASPNNSCALCFRQFMFLKIILLLSRVSLYAAVA